MTVLGELVSDGRDDGPHVEQLGRRLVAMFGCRDLSATTSKDHLNPSADNFIRGPNQMMDGDAVLKNNATGQRRRCPPDEGPHKQFVYLRSQYPPLERTVQIVENFVLGEMEEPILDHGSPLGREVHDVVARRLARMEKRTSGHYIAVISNVPAVCSLQHFNAGVVIRRDNTNRNVGKQLPHDAAVS
jgi:hypothetical protein